MVYQTNTPTSSEVVPQNIPLNIVFEDDDILVVNKPAGMVVHPGSGNPDGTLINAVAYYLKNKGIEIDESEMPRYGLVHRIDKNTSGIIIIAKTELAMTRLAKDFFD